MEGEIERGVSRRNNSPDTDDVVAVAGVEGGTIGRPSKGGAVGDEGLAGPLDTLVGVELGNDVLVLQVPDGDATVGGGAEPVAGRGEAEGMDLRASGELVEPLALAKVPEHGLAVTAAGGAEGTVGGDGNGADEASVADKPGAELEVSGRPDLDGLVVRGSHEQRGVSGGGVPDGGDPVRVGIINGELALADGVVEADGAVTAGGEDLPVVGGEGDGEDVLLGAEEGAAAVTGGEVVQAARTVPRGGDGVLAVKGELDVRHKVLVAGQALDGESNGLLLAGEVPGDDSLVTGTGDEEVGVGLGGGEAGNPAGVAAELAAKSHDVAHLVSGW
jgi:hypothetical protein